MSEIGALEPIEVLLSKIELEAMEVVSLDERKEGSDDIELSLDDKEFNDEMRLELDALASMTSEVEKLSFVELVHEISILDCVSLWLEGKGRSQALKTSEKNRIG